MRKLNTFLVTGYSRAPQGTSMYEIHKHAGIVLEINFVTHTIERVDFTFVADLTKDYFKKLLEGYCLENGLETLIERIQNHYFAPSQQSVIVALQAAVQRYWDCVNEKQ